mgnify:CR=1 FL=1
MRILLVEDDPELADSLTRMLKAGGWTVDTLHDGVVADQALRGEDYALAILDVGLPRMDGFEVLRLLRERGQTLAVLMLTARGEVADRVRGLSGQPLQLPSREHAVLENLIARPGRLMSKEQLAGKVFGLDQDANPEAIEIYISRLRRKLDGSPVRIVTFRGLGYLLEASS